LSACIPHAASFLLGFQDATIAGGMSPVNGGLANYERMRLDLSVSTALRNSLYFTFVEVIAVIGLSLGLHCC
jgi:ABC-type sugar transport system permease subunit